MNQEGRADTTRALADVAAGETSAVSRLLPLVYDELRAIAARYLRNEHSDHTLQATALVHEAFVRLIDSSVRVDWRGRAHFRAVAARAMRQLLVDHARRKGAAKRGGKRRRVPLDSALAAPDAFPVLDLADFEPLLKQLEALDAQMCRIVEMRYFAGMETQEVAHVLGVTDRTIRNKLSVARAWLSRQLEAFESR